MAVKKECKYALHIPAKYGVRPDLHMVKEVTYMEDGTEKTALRLIKDYKRPYYITKLSKRDHNDKKEWELKENLDMYHSTQSDMRKDIVKNLGQQFNASDYNAYRKSQFVYGAEITSTALIKKAYKDKYAVTPVFSVSAFDTETSMVDGSIIVASLAFKDEVIIAVTKDFVAFVGDVDLRLKQAIAKYLPKYKDTLKVHLHVVDNDLEIVKVIFAQAHTWKPDLLAIWRIDFDMPKVLSTLEKHKVDPTSVLCDPSIPEPARFCKYKQGPLKKITASGVLKPLAPSSQWHTLYLTAGFYAIDAMSVYRQVRTGKPEEPNYRLNDILTKELNTRKLNFEEAAGYEEGAWHSFMQKNFPIEYMVYNIYDCLGMLELDAKTNDLSHSFPAFADITDFDKFTSQPKRNADALHFYCLEKDRVLGVAPPMETTIAADVAEDNEEDGEEDEEDYSEGLGLRGWIVTLPAHLMTDDGYACIKEDPTLRTNIRGMVFDSDVESSYPNCTIVANVSKETTKTELLNIQGIDVELFKMQNLNLVSSPIMNSLEYCVNVFGLPNSISLLEEFTRQSS